MIYYNSVEDFWTSYKVSFTIPFNINYEEGLILPSSLKSILIHFTKVVFLLLIRNESIDCYS